MLCKIWCWSTLSGLHMQIGLCQRGCQTPVGLNEVSEEPSLIFMSHRSTCTDRKHSASTWWDVNSNTAALLGQDMHGVFKKQHWAQWMIKYVIHTHTCSTYLHFPRTSLPSCVSHYAFTKSSYNLVIFSFLYLNLTCAPPPPPQKNNPKTKPKTQKTKQNKQINSLNQHEMQINQQKNPSLKPVGLGGDDTAVLNSNLGVGKENFTC